MVVAIAFMTTIIRSAGLGLATEETEKGESGPGAPPGADTIPAVARNDRIAINPISRLVLAS
jgi:hypothetical protein